jgi:hypothetical protein
MVRCRRTGLEAERWVGRKGHEESFLRLFQTALLRSPCTAPLLCGHTLCWFCPMAQESSGNAPPRASSVVSSAPSSLSQLLLKFSHSFLLSIKRLFHPQTAPDNSTNSTDINLLITTILLLLSLLSPWLLILAFISLLPAIYSQLLAMHLPPPTISSPLSQSSEQTIDPSSNDISPSHSDAAANPAGSSLDEPENVTLPSSAKKHRKVKKKVAREEWGIPTLRVIDSNGKVVPVNPDTPTPMETDCFKGFILIMLKCDGEHEEHDRYKHHFKGKQRKFEVQFQVSPSFPSSFFLLTRVDVLGPNEICAPRRGHSWRRVGRSNASELRHAILVIFFDEIRHELKSFFTLRVW